MAPASAVADRPALVLADVHGEAVALRAHLTASADPAPPPRPAAVPLRRAAPAPAATLPDLAEATRLGRISFTLTDGIRRQRRLRIADIPGYDQLVARAREASERGDDPAIQSALTAMRSATDATRIDAAFIARKHARLAGKLAAARASEADRRVVEGYLAQAEQLAARGHFTEANGELENVARSLSSERN
jgi:hypothetical protein